VLISSDGETRRLPVPVQHDDTTLTGVGWTLRLSTGWVARRGPRQGDFEVAKP
jgi:hypothetical protein